MIKAILFDFNGVIIDDEPLQMKAYQEVLADEGIALTEAQYYECLGMDDKTFIEAAYARAGKDLEVNKSLEVKIAKTNRWRELVAAEVPLFPGVEDFIRKMAQEFELGIVSMARREEIEYILERTNLANCFSAIVSAEDVTVCKPDSQCYRTGFRLIDAVHTRRRHSPITHGECLVIEDSPQGIMAARNADLKALGVTNTVSAGKLREAGADAVAKNLDDWTAESVRLVFV
ncbi:MAG TPA: HAD family phosphatase [Pyrinomonadaceae bacterium]|jgi:phosphoglycolate phosphatase/beta-phosphoglucomutase